MHDFEKNKHLKVKVCYGSENGYAESIAKLLFNKISTIDKSISKINDLKIEEYQSHDIFIFILSTGKNGNFPKNSNEIIYKIRKIDNFENINYILLGIGDSSYNNYCTPSKALDKMLIKNKCNKIIDTVFLDDAYDHNEDLKLWIEKTYLAVKEFELNLKKKFTISMNTNLL